MIPLLLTLAALPACYLAHLLVEHIYFQFFPPVSRQKAVAIIGCAIIISFSILVFSLTHSVLDLLYVFIAVSGITHLYFHIYNFTETARRIRILVAKYQQRELKAYSPETMIDERIKRLTAMGSLEEVEGNFRVRRGLMLLVAFTFSLWGRLFGISSTS